MSNRIVFATELKQHFQQNEHIASPIAGQRQYFLDQRPPLTKVRIKLSESINKFLKDPTEETIFLENFDIEFQPILEDLQMRLKKVSEYTKFLILKFSQILKQSCGSRFISNLISHQCGSLKKQLSIAQLQKEGTIVSGVIQINPIIGEWFLEMNLIENDSNSFLEQLLDKVSYQISNMLSQTKRLVAKKYELELLDEFKGKLDLSCFNQFVSHFQRANIKFTLKNLNSEQLDYFLNSVKQNLRMSSESIQGFQNILKGQISQSFSYLEKLEFHQLNLINLSTCNSKQLIKQYLIHFQASKLHLELLFIFLKLTAVCDEFLILGSNAAFLLVKLNAKFIRHNLSYVRLFGVSLQKGNFFRSDLSYSRLRNVDISACNFQEANLENVSWLGMQHVELSLIRDHKKSVNSAEFFKNGLIVTGSSDSTIRIYNPKLETSKILIKAHVGSIWCVTISKSQKYLASAGDDMIIKLWDVQTRKELKRYYGHIKLIVEVAFSPDDTLLVSGSQDFSIRVWDVTTGKQMKVLTGFTAVWSVVFSPEKKTVVSAWLDGKIKIWDFVKGVVLRQLVEHTQCVSTVLFCLNGSCIVSSSQDKTIRIWEAKTGRRIRILSGHTKPIWGINVSHDGGNYIVSGSDDSTIRVWDANLGVQLIVFSGHTDGVLPVNFSYDGRYIVSAGVDKTIRIWNANLQKLHQQVAIHKNSEQSVSASEKEFMATPDLDYSIHVWNQQTGKLIQQLQGHEKPVLFLHFSKQNTELLSVSLDCSIKVWDFLGGKLIREIRAPGAITPDMNFYYIFNEQELLIGMQDTISMVWNLGEVNEVRKVVFQDAEAKLNFMAINGIRAEQEEVALDQFGGPNLSAEPISAKGSNVNEAQITNAVIQTHGGFNLVELFRKQGAFCQV